MLFAVDIDGTIASTQETDAYNVYLAAVLGLRLPDEWRSPHGRTADVLELDEVRDYQASSEDAARRLAAVIADGQYSPLVQERAVPIPGAVSGMNALAE